MGGKRKCNICGKPLSSYNQKNHCFCHDVSKLILDEPREIIVYGGPKRLYGFGVAIAQKQYQGKWD